MPRPTTIAGCGLALLLLLGSGAATEPAAVPTYDALRAAFESPDHANWGEVPLWWWEGQAMTKERATAQLEELASQGGMSVCPIRPR